MTIRKSFAFALSVPLCALAVACGGSTPEPETAASEAAGAEEAPFEEEAAPMEEEADAFEEEAEAVEEDAVGGDEGEAGEAEAVE